MGGGVCPVGVGTGEGCADSDGRELGKSSYEGALLTDGFADTDGCWLGTGGV